MGDVYRTPAADCWLTTICQNPLDYVHRHIVSGQSVSRHDAAGEDLWVTTTNRGYLISLRRDQVF